MVLPKIKRSYVSDAEKEIRTGMGYLRFALGKKMLREGFAIWKSEYIMGNKEALAMRVSGVAMLIHCLLSLIHFYSFPFFVVFMC